MLRVQDITKATKTTIGAYFQDDVDETWRNIAPMGFPLDSISHGEDTASDFPRMGRDHTLGNGGRVVSRWLADLLGAFFSPLPGSSTEASLGTWMLLLLDRERGPFLAH